MVTWPTCLKRTVNSGCREEQPRHSPPEFPIWGAGCSWPLVRLAFTFWAFWQRLTSTWTSWRLPYPRHHSSIWSVRHGTQAYGTPNWLRFTYGTSWWSDNCTATDKQYPDSELTLRRTMRRKALVPVPSAPHHIKHAKKRKAYVLVPPAPYRIKTMREAYVSASPAPHRLPGQGSHSHRRSHANPSTSALLVTRGELQPTVNRPEQRVPLSQVDGKAPCRQSRHRAADTSHATSRSTKYFTELTAESITDKVMERLKRFDSMWVSKYFDLFFTNYG